MAKAKKAVNPQVIRAEMQALRTQLDEQLQENAELTSAFFILSDRIDELENENHKLALQFTKGKGDEAARVALTEAVGISCEDLVKILGGINRMTARTCLLIIEALLPDRIVVSPNAYSSASEISKDFKNTDQLMNLLSKLALDGVDTLRFGGRIEEVFTPNQYSSHESKTTMGNDELKLQRVCYWKGKRIVMEKHLKIGVANDISFTLRVHFEWLADEGKILIGHCGEHLDI